MQIPSCHLASYLENASASIDVRRPKSEGGTLAFTLTPTEALDYAEAECIEGVSRGQRLKYLILLKPFEEARQAVFEVRISRHGKPFDVLRKMAADRKFYYREQLGPSKDEYGIAERSGRWTWMHK